MDSAKQLSFGVFKPVGNIVISFPDREKADAAAAEMMSTGLAPEAILHLSDREMVEKIDSEMPHASSLAAIGQELNLVQAMRKLAAQGYHWLVVRARDNESDARIAQIAERHDAARAQSYGHFIIEELIDRPGDAQQVAESPDRGLDAETPSGEERDAAVVATNKKGVAGF